MAPILHEATPLPPSSQVTSPRQGHGGGVARRGAAVAKRTVGAARSTFSGPNGPTLMQLPAPSHTLTDPVMATAVSTPFDHRRRQCEGRLSRVGQPAPGIAGRAVDRDVGGVPPGGRGPHWITGGSTSNVPRRSRRRPGWRALPAESVRRAVAVMVVRPRAATVTSATGPGTVTGGRASAHGREGDRSMPMPASMPSRLTVTGSGAGSSLEPSTPRSSGSRRRSARPSRSVAGRRASVATTS